MEEIETEFGNIKEMFAALDKKPVNTVKRMLFIFLKENQPDLTLQEVGRLVVYSDIDRITHELTDALR